ncbi:AP-3 complex subunit sigma, putative [Plasmodium vivax]|uniref:AP complex subunit sigma n=6 Tax=Plasmodium vivax TaxID=5855 RepID=A5K908_PLAVS|nr:adaptor-related protein complex 3, sigma 2 subunit, putative [Plasmodium vivax]KMZ77589.1 adaptor-like protein complex 3, sigma 2 subunit [Plasmodium vivax India VII]KMZ84749.1 adaptor-like protein complex 3, sigma 2 subunit [Plasmodium vivax Brazil I]KMZ90028.1 adaptor-like protein complex 3, sigma 2 subunit [Plasmodium vivax Mauritania I]KMZ96584.1 adaptor-like protein complex 3, sigma 2 subunit [Plasmodium vivax North Korean]EDL44304.1 adaptor-related protein complex 3, sigma 2 subunit, |eukprot:XP_001614031.1 adaptor-related protein complex 3, sigma 2 subunit [Plasmodium vivax Sal-1]
MIKGVLIINNNGKPRFLRFYDGSSHERQQMVTKRIHETIKKRITSECCCFLEDEELFSPDVKIVYRHFATLYFIFIIDSMESELGILDLIQVFVQVLDANFENVCELDLIYNYEQINYILDEIIMGGIVLETNIDAIVGSINGAKKLIENESSFFGD